MAAERRAQSVAEVVTVNPSLERVLGTAHRRPLEVVSAAAH
jgi:hypothetical protein